MHYHFFDDCFSHLGPIQQFYQILMLKLSFLGIVKITFRMPGLNYNIGEKYASQ